MRITSKHLDTQVQQLNNMLNQNPDPYTNNKANIGTYYIDSAYGAYRVVRLVSESGGIEDTSLRDSARATYTFLCGMIRGIQATNNQ